MTQFMRNREEKAYRQKEDLNAIVQVLFLQEIRCLSAKNMGRKLCRLDFVHGLVKGVFLAAVLVGELSGESERAQERQAVV